MFYFYCHFKVTFHDRYYKSRCERREVCKFNCEDEVYPNLTCGPDSSLSLTYGGQFYDKVFKYEYSGTSGWFECANYANDNIDYMATLPDGSHPRIHTCFPSCLQSTSGVFDFEDDSAGISTEFRTTCASGVTPDLLCVDDSDSCQTTKFSGEICFGDDSTTCIQFGMIFITMFIASPIIFFVELIFLFNMRLVTKKEPDNSRLDFKSSIVQCGFQWLSAAIIITVIFYLIVQMIFIVDFGRPKTMGAIFGFVVLFEQIRSFIVQTLIWFILITKAGQLETTEIVIDDPQAKNKGFLKLSHKIIKIIVESDFFDHFTLGLVIFYAVWVLVQLTFDSDIEANPTATEVFHVFDILVLVLFLTELILRVIVEGYKYFFDLWNVFDATIIIVSFVFTFVEIPGKQGVFVLRLMRLLRLVLILRKAAKKASPRRPPGTGPALTSPIERVLSLVRDVSELKKGVTPKDKENLEWVQDVISSNKLYSIAVENMGRSGKQNSDYELELQYWLRMTTDQLQDANWRDEELESLLQGKARKAQQQQQQSEKNSTDPLVDIQKRRKRQKLLKSSEIDPHADEAQNGTIIINQANGAKTKIGERGVVIEDDSDFSDSEDSDFDPDQMVEEVMQNAASEEISHQISDELVTFRMGLQQWDFDIFSAEMNFGQELLLPMVGVQCAQNLDLFNALDINPESFFEFSRAVAKQYFAFNTFSNATHAADVCHAAHLLYKWLGDDKPVLGPVELLAGLMSAIGIDVGHPGVNNMFLIRTTHPLAVRYADTCPLENLHASTLFELLMTSTDSAHFKHQQRLQRALKEREQVNNNRTGTDQGLSNSSSFRASKKPLKDPFKRLSEEQFTLMRTLVIRAIIASDSGNHASLLSLFKTKCTRRDFPSARADDKEVVISTFTRAADIAYIAKPLGLSTTWVDRLMEEFYRQGDIEKMRHLQRAKFYVREENNVSKCQIGFIDLVASPMFDALANFLPHRYAEQFHPHVARTKAHYKNAAPKSGGAFNLPFGDDFVDVGTKRKDAIKNGNDRVHRSNSHGPLIPEEQPPGEENEFRSKSKKNKKKD